MSSIADHDTLERLVERLGALRTDTERLWGTMTPGEMLCHLGDATEAVLGRGAVDGGRASKESPRKRPILKWIALRAPLAWPRGIKTVAEADPQRDGTKPVDFEADRRRVVDSLRAFAAAPAGDLVPSHSMFGPMSPGDWYRWAYRHTDHHLRQFGL